MIQCSGALGVRYEPVGTRGGGHQFAPVQVVALDDAPAPPPPPPPPPPALRPRFYRR